MIRQFDALHEKAVNDPANLTSRFQRGISTITSFLRRGPLPAAVLAIMLVAVPAPSCLGQQVVTKETADGHTDTVQSRDGRVERDYDKQNNLKSQRTYNEKDKLIEEQFYGPDGKLSETYNLQYTDGKLLLETGTLFRNGVEYGTVQEGFDQNERPIRVISEEGNIRTVTNVKHERAEDGRTITTVERTVTDLSSGKETRSQFTPNGWVDLPAESSKNDGTKDTGKEPHHHIVEDLKMSDEDFMKMLDEMDARKENKADTQKETPPKSNNDSSLPGTNTTSTIGVFNPKIDLFTGYTFSHYSLGGNQSSSNSNNQSSGGTGLNFNGGSSSIVVNFTPVFGLVGDFGIYHNNTSGVGTNQFTYLFGPQFAIRGNDRFTPFFHVLMGGAHQSERSSVSSNSSSNSGNAFAVAAGGGLNVHVSPHIAIRVAQIDYLLTKFQDGRDDRQNNVRVSAGVVFRWGGTPPAN